jgi:hypothetical protein
VLRARGELCVAASFAQITGELIALGAERSLIRIAADAVGEETRHADLWLELAGTYQGHKAPWQPAGDPNLPSYPSAEAWLVPALRVVGMCCINETIATVRLREASKLARVGPLKQVLRRILADEIHHSRLGWAFLASSRVSTPIRHGLSAWLVPLLKANLESLFADVRKLDDSLSAHGVPSQEQTRTDVLAALNELVLPGFDNAGLETSTARAWVHQQFFESEPGA